MADFNPNSRSFFDSFSSSVAQDLMTLQLTAGQPEPTNGISTVSDPIIPDRTVLDRLAHFDPEVYDLRDESHLVKLLKVLLGGAGVGGLRKQLSVARLQNTFSGMHFLDLDRFYGALFGIRRLPSEIYPNQDFDPYVGAASPDDWDDIHSRDASYRDRLTKFTKTIPLGATYKGLKAMAEALTAVECEIYESWSDVDDYLESKVHPRGLIYTYDFMGKGYPSWGALEGTNWNKWGGGGVITLGRTGQNTRGDFIVQPKRPLTQTESYELLRVLDRFRPAGTQFTVASSGLDIHQTAEVRGVAASSEYWEVVQKVTPSDQYFPRPSGLGSTWGSVVTDGKPYLTYDPNLNQPRPAFSQYQGESWYYNDDVLYVMPSMIDENGLEYPNNNESVTFNDGIINVFRGVDAILPGSQAMSGKIVADGVMTAGAYAQSRATAQGAV